MRKHGDAGDTCPATLPGRYVVERQMLYRPPPHERNYWIAWAIWDRRVRTFLAARFASREEAKRHVAGLRSLQEPGEEATGMSSP